MPNDAIIRSYDSDHTALVQVLWTIDSAGLTLKDFDEVASRIMRSKWMKATKLHAVEQAAKLPGSK